MTKAILITGAAGGLGQAIVKTCREKFTGHTIIATDVTPAIKTMFDPSIVCLQLDVSDEASIAEGRKVLEEKGLRIQYLVNNAGISDFFPVTEKPKDNLQKIFAINTFGAVNMVRIFLPHLIETKGRVVNISSESVRLPAAFHPYAASKIALEALSVSMRNELALNDVTLSIIRPGAINTPFLDDLTSMQDRIGDSIYREYLENFGTKAPKEIHNICEPVKVATVVVKALQQQKPKRYYHVNNNPKLRIAQKLPHWLKDYFMQKMLKSS